MLTTSVPQRRKCAAASPLSRLLPQIGVHLGGVHDDLVRAVDWVHPLRVLLLLGLAEVSEELGEGDHGAVLEAQPFQQFLALSLRDLPTRYRDQDPQKRLPERPEQHTMTLDVTAVMT